MENLSRSRTAPVRLAERARIVLLAADGLQDKEIGEKMGIPRQKAPTVGVDVGAKDQIHRLIRQLAARARAFHIRE